MTPEEIAKKNIEEFNERLDRSIERLKMLSNTDLRESFRLLFLSQGKSSAQAEQMAELAVKGIPSCESKINEGKPDSELEIAFRSYYIAMGKPPQEAERLAEAAASGR